jgi:hypothetical protein
MILDFLGWVSYFTFCSLRGNIYNLTSGTAPFLLGIVTLAPNSKNLRRISSLIPIAQAKLNGVLLFVHVQSLYYYV